MRGVSSRIFRGTALLTLLVVLTSPTLIADEGVGPPPPPEARVSPPIGSNARIQPPIGMVEVLLWLLAKIGPPIG
jgi:hypothetical protein